MKTYNPYKQTICILLFAVLLAGCSGSSTGPDNSRKADIQIISTSSHGKVLANSEGRVLYYFTKDEAGTSNCTEACLSTWPIFHTAQLQVGNKLNAAKFGSIVRPNGRSQVTYKGWPLYYYSGDNEPGEVNGHGINNTWFVARKGIDPAPGYSNPDNPDNPDDPDDPRY